MVPLVFQASNLAASYEKKQKKIDQEIAQWKAKVDEVQAELEASQRESRANSTEVSTLICVRSSVVTSSTKPFSFVQVYKLRAQLEESQDANEQLRREKKSLEGTAATRG